MSEIAKRIQYSFERGQSLQDTQAGLRTGGNHFFGFEKGANTFCASKIGGKCFSLDFEKRNKDFIGV